jgi:hypothetical protein
MSKPNRTAALDRYDEAIADILAYLRTQGASIDAVSREKRLGSSFLAGADLATRMIYDGVRSGLARGFARRLAHRKVGHA